LDDKATLDGCDLPRGEGGAELQTLMTVSPQIATNQADQQNLTLNACSNQALQALPSFEPKQI